MFHTFLLNHCNFVTVWRKKMKNPLSVWNLCRSWNGFWRPKRFSCHKSMWTYPDQTALWRTRLKGIGCAVRTSERALDLADRVQREWLCQTNIPRPDFLKVSRHSKEVFYKESGKLRSLSFVSINDSLSDSAWIPQYLWMISLSLLLRMHVLYLTVLKCMINVPYKASKAYLYIYPLQYTLLSSHEHHWNIL